MSRLIAGVYEIPDDDKNVIGQGGGGIVYLGYHTRLHKPVVLKSDRRTLKAGEEALRREVDLLKGLTNTYIPQVYDYVEEDGVVYTVMDYIEGESLDKKLKRGEIPTQAQVIRWACQLLDALHYLHTRPPYGILHGDIKPANIMIRPNGDVCLIDFNIALALGEDGAVQVGFSQGYASPEHYGVTYVHGVRTMMDSQLPTENGVTEEGNSNTVAVQYGEHGTAVADENIPGQKKPVVLNARSDIYSLGATLYHVISGKLPEANAEKVRPLGQKACSPVVSHIIAKAMQPDPADRYQSAEEMLDAFLSLYKADPRSIRHRRRECITAAALAMLFLIGGGITFIGMKKRQNLAEAKTLAEYSEDALAKGNVSEAIRLALNAIPTEGKLFDAPVTAEAEKALSDATNVYDLKDSFAAVDLLKLPSEPFSVKSSPDHTKLLVTYAYAASVYEISSRKEIAKLPLEASALSDAMFTDDTHVLYAGENGVSLYDLSTGSNVWTGNKATTLAVSKYSDVVAAVNRDESKATIYEKTTGKILQEVDFEGHQMEVPNSDQYINTNDRIFALSEDGLWLAVSFRDGSLILFKLQIPADPDNNLELSGASDFNIFHGSFTNGLLSLTMEDASGSQLFLFDPVKQASVADYATKNSLLLDTDDSHIYLGEKNLIESLDIENKKEQELAMTTSDVWAFAISDDYILTSEKDGTFSVFDRGAHLMSSEKADYPYDFLTVSGDYVMLGDRQEPSIRILHHEKHEDAKLITYDPSYSHDEARISEDGSTVMLFDIHGFRIYDREGKIVKEEALPDSDSIYDQQFRRKDEKSYLEVFWYDGTIRQYDAKDGSLLIEKKESAPDPSLEETFDTSTYHFVSKLHSPAEAYDSFGNLVGTLEKDASLTYITESGPYIVAQYVAASTGEKFGILMNQKLETLAKLPGLMDVMDGKLIFDYGNGVLYQRPIYSLDELKTIAEKIEH